MSETTGILLMAYGTPATLDDIEPYYTHIRHGRPPPDDLLAELRERYETVGGTTPLLRITAETRDALEQQLGTGYRVFLGMKHWHPYIEHGVQEMADAGITRAVGLILAPHYSRMSIAQYYDYLSKAQEKLGTSIEILPIESWHLHQPYLDAIARRVEQALPRLASPDAKSTSGTSAVVGHRVGNSPFPNPEERGGGSPSPIHGGRSGDLQSPAPVHHPPTQRSTDQKQTDVTVIFTAHSLPTRILAAGDPYPDQLRETSETLARMLDLTHWTFAYQSAGRTADPWLGPDLVEVIHRLADEGVRKALVAPIGFVSDHLEILYDIDYEAQQAAAERGMTLSRIEMLNASPDFVAGLADLVRARTMPQISSEA